jgi:hypothetical protein
MTGTFSRLAMVRPISALLASAGATKPARKSGPEALMPINDGLQDPRVDRERSIEPIHNPGYEGDAGSCARALNS